MSKHLYWNVILLSIFIVTSSNAYSQHDVQKIVQDLKRQYKGLEHNQSFKQNIIEQHKHLAEKRIKFKKLKNSFLTNLNYFQTSANTIKTVNPTAYKYVSNFVDKNKNSSLYQLFIFYFTSESMPKIALERFYSSLKYLEKKFPKQLTGYAIYRGFPKDFKTFYKRYNSQKIGGGVFKIHPIMYKYYDLKSVPAYAYAECQKSVFKFKSCKNHMLIRGDLSLKGALDIFSQENITLKPYYHYLIDAK